MSKGPGRVERAIEAAFKANPDGYFSVADLVRLAFPGAYINRSKRVAVVRAAHKVAKRLHWVMFRSNKQGAEGIFANGLSLRSYGLGRVRAYLGWAGVHKYESGPDGKLVRGRLMTPAERIVDRLETDEWFVKRMKPGAEFALAVEYHTAVANGETERAGELGALIERRHQEALRAMTAAIRALG